MVDKNSLNHKLYKIADSLDFCCLYDTETELLDRLVSSRGYGLSEVSKMIEEISLSAMMFNQHEGRLGNLRCIIGNFDNLCIGTYVIHDSVLLIIGIDKKKISDNESDFILREISRIVSSEQNN
jgi:hypothetical protein